jgi:hypothetical protein
MIVSLISFILGIIVIMVSGTDGHKESMNFVSYLGVAIMVFGFIYPFTGIAVELFKKIFKIKK